MRGRGVVRAVAAGMGIACAGCAAMPPMQMGQTAGTIIGAAVAPGLGAPLGALIGQLAGLLVQHQVDQAVERQERKELGSQLAAHPKASDEAPSEPTHVRGVGRVWVDETVRNGRVTPGHFEQW